MQHGFSVPPGVALLCCQPILYGHTVSQGATDMAGNTTVQIAEVVVPHDNGNKNKDKTKTNNGKSKNK